MNRHEKVEIIERLGFLSRYYGRYHMSLIKYIDNHQAFHCDIELDGSFITWLKIDDLGENINWLA
jgi:hypothetical protein